MGSKILLSFDLRANERLKKTAPDGADPWTDGRTDGHGNSMTESAHSVKMLQHFEWFIHN